MAFAALWMMGAVGCQTGAGAQRQDAPVMPMVLPEAPPAKLPAHNGSNATLVQHTDGFYYAVGFTDPVKVGDDVMLRYGGEWSKRAGRRPLLGLMQVVKTWPAKPDAAMVQPVYMLPGASLKDVQAVLWNHERPPEVGKGLGQLGSIQGSNVQISLDGTSGIQPGDRYLVIGKAAADERLGQRIKGVVMVTQIDQRGARGRLLRSNGPAGAAAEGDTVVFVGAGDERSPLKGIIEVGKIAGADQTVQLTVASMLDIYLKELGVQNMAVAVVDVEGDPLDPFYGADDMGRDPVDMPRMMLNGAFVDGRFIFNYTNTGLSVAHAMIAATPEEGMGAGGPSKMGMASMAPIFHNLVAAALTHRGQNARAIHLLESALAPGGWAGRTRWHARDQLAMRWSQIGNHWEALRSVQQDVARAEANDDKPAIINAVGTLMPLYEEVERMELSLDAAERFYTMRKDLGEGINTTHAWRFFIETMYKAGKTEDAEREFAKLTEACQPALKLAQDAFAAGEAPDKAKVSCILDLYGALMSFYWQTSDADKRGQLLEQAEAYAELYPEINKGSIRLIQAMAMLGNNDPDGAMIGFMEARRLFEKDGYTQGMARVDLLTFNLHVLTGQRQLAFEAAMNAADTYARLRDTQEVIGAYRTLLRLYASVPPQDMNFEAYARSAHEVMSEALRLQLAGDDLAGAAEVFLVSGRFRIPTNPQQAVALMERASEVAVRATRFDIAAMSQLNLAMLSDAMGDAGAFQSHLEMAKEYARILGDAELLQNIIQLERGGGGDEPTTL